MASQPSSERFKADMPQIPGVSSVDARISTSVNPASKIVIGVLAVLLVSFVGARWAVRFGLAPSKAAEQPQIEVPSPAPDPSTLLPHATDSAPGIAEIEEVAKPWSYKGFYFQSKGPGESIPAVLVRLPGGSGSQAGGYWAFSVNAPFGSCKLEYVTDLKKLKADYGFRATHPMVGNPCSRTVFDPLKMSSLPGNVFARGGIVQGSDLRPPLSIEIQVRGKEILAVRAE